MNLRKKSETLGVNILVCIISIILITPLLLILINSFKTSREAAFMSLALPASLNFSNFSLVIQRGKLGQTFLNSMTYSLFSVILTTLLASMAAYVLSRNRNRLHTFLYFFIVLGITMPINFVTLVKVMQVLQLINTRGGVILLYCAIQMPFNVFLIYSFIGKIPCEIDEAGVIDGCS
ncbi:MAG: carbohydrate ABC transporter permease, partial [Oscillospiraceae bacterium]|nr:carbohydrate ABC transporter permease [Oscillospiraceae bacterium]